VIELGEEDVVEKCLRRLADSGEMGGAEGIVGDSPPMRELRRRIKAASRVNSTVLIQGETGTGKGLVARAIHAGSDRSDAPFVHVDCAALAPTLVESELFGHERGAFTGATALRRGRFELAGSGTIFLDEVSEIEPRLQSKLLRVIEDKVYERVGGTQPLLLRARIIAATNRDLYQAVNSGEFRRDLYFRLNVVAMKILPLRERLSDIPLLVDLALQRAKEALGVVTPRVSDDFHAHLTDHTWPGNVRELLNLVERALVERRVDVLEPEILDELLDPLSGLEPEAPAASALDAAKLEGEAAVIAAALADTGGNVSRTARRLGMPRGTLRYKIKMYGLVRLIPKD
jgi:DNA-binding NtrC family response regulator